MSYGLHVAGWVDKLGLRHNGPRFVALIAALLVFRGLWRAFLVHRLDRGDIYTAANIICVETSGAIIVVRANCQRSALEQLGRSSDCHSGP